MLKRLKSHTGPSALIVAVIALLIGLGGAAFAAHKLSGSTIKKGSEPGNRLKDNSVTGNQINESTLVLPAAAVNIFGVSVDSGGSVTKSTLPGVTDHHDGTGLYTVTFPRNIQNCSPVVSQADGGPAEPARAFVSGTSNVLVSTGTGGVDHAFNLVVAC